MKTKNTTRAFSFLLALLLCVCTVYANPNVSKAAEKKYEELLTEVGNATANQEIEYNYTVDINTNIYFVLAVPAPVNVEASVYDSVGKLCGSSISINESDWVLSKNAYIYMFNGKNMSAGDYSIKLTFDEASEYVLAVEADKEIATISTKSATVTAGFTKRLKVNNTKEKITWTSSKKSIATVDSKGIVTAKKAGKATITAKTASGQKLTCKITVKANTYKETKLSVSDIDYGSCGLQVYNAYYASNGDLVLKCKFLNNSGYKVNALKKTKITFKTNSGKTIGTYSSSSKNMSVATASSKDFTVTIKKSKLKIKKADLRNARYTTSGKYQYRYYS